MGSMNKCFLLGNLGRDAELRYTPGGQPVSTLNLATTDTWTDKQGAKKEQTEWHRVILWGKQAESLSEYLKKGKQVLIEGSIHTRKWQDKDGNDKYSTEIKAHRVTLLGGGKGGGGGRPHPADATEDGGAQDPAYATEGAQPAEPVSELTDDDIPF